MVYWAVLALWLLLSVQSLAVSANILFKSVYLGQRLVKIAIWLCLKLRQIRQKPPLNLNKLYVFINLTLYYHSGTWHLSNKSTGLLLDMRKCPLFTSLNSLLDYYLVVRRVFFKGHFSNQNNQSAERSENVVFTFFYKRIPGLGDELSEYVQIIGIRDRCILLQVSGR